ncbi:phage tail protein, partial [Xenorhabdus thuongxuanensis]
APTPAQDANNTQIATTAFVQSLANAANNNANTRLEKNKNGADILDKPAFVKNLGLTAGSALPVGVPIPWPLATPPAGWIKCNGATFTAAQYPELARVYPSLRLPDLRGEFIRGWDDSGKIDPGRALLSLQSGSVGRHDHAFNQTWGATGPDSTGGRYPVSADTNGAALDLPIYTDYYGGNETRPRNIAFNYIVRAV